MPVNDYWGTESTELDVDEATPVDLQGNPIVSGVDRDIPKSIIDAKGDLIVGTGADTPARLAAGGVGQALVVAADGSLDWETPASAEHTHDIYATDDDLTAHAATPHGGTHPDLAAHDTLGLATQAELDGHAAAADPHTGYQKESEKGAASGYAGLNASSVVVPGQLGTGTMDGSGVYIRGTDTGSASWSAIPDADLPSSIARDSDVDTKMSDHLVSSDPHPTYAKDIEIIPSSIVDAKGDLIVASAIDAVARLPVGANDQVLTADSAQTLGVKWAAVAGGEDIPYQASPPAGPATGDLWVDSDENTAVASPSPTPDTLPNTSHAKDDEFNDTALAAKWAWVNQGATTYSEANGWGTLTVPASGTSSLRCLVQPAPAGAFTMTAKLSCMTSGAGAGGVYAILMRDSVSGKILSVGSNMGTSNNPINVYQWNSTTSWNGQVASVGGEMWRGGVLYFRFRRNSNTSYDTWFSRDGVGWFPINAAWNPSAFVASIDQIGFFGDSENGVVNIMSVDWFRVTE